MSWSKFLQALNSKKPNLAVLVDPDKFNPELIKLASKTKVACFLVGGSKLENGDLNKTVKEIKKIAQQPVVIFPGDETQLSASADGLLLLSLLSGRNPDYLIGKHVKAAQKIKKMKIASIPIAYLLIGREKLSTTQTVTKTLPLDPGDHSEIINTCLAAEQLGFKAIYLEAGSGASTPISLALIKKVKKIIEVPLIVGGGIDSTRKVNSLIRAGVNLIVVGNALEKNVYLLPKLNSCF